MNRPAIQKLIADIKGCDTVLVYKLDRLSRSQRDTLYLVEDVLGNETYTGRLRFGEIIVENAHEAIISKEQFRMAQIIQAKRREKYGTTAFRSKYLLTGMLFCCYYGARYFTSEIQVSIHITPVTFV